MGIEKFEFERSRGIVWVCDLSKSSAFLNDNKAADALEDFLPRLYWSSVMTVEAAGGRFIKWTGDGFLAWFETPIHRLMPTIIDQIFHGAYFLTALVNVTQLGVKSSNKFRVRHGVCLEHDALVIKISHTNYESLDLIGRAVVLAFRLSSLAAGFPNIVTQGDLVASAPTPVGYCWKKRRLTREDRLKYFKGEQWGTKSIFVSSDATKKMKSVKSTLRSMKGALASFDAPSAVSQESFGAKLVPKFLNGPEWCRDAIQEYADHAKKMYDLVSEVLPAIEHLTEDAKTTGAKRQPRPRKYIM